MSDRAISKVRVEFGTNITVGDYGRGHPILEMLTLGVGADPIWLAEFADAPGEWLPISREAAFAFMGSDVAKHG